MQNSFLPMIKDWIEDSCRFFNYLAIFNVLICANKLISNTIGYHTYCTLFLKGLNTYATFHSMEICFTFCLKIVKSSIVTEILRILHFQNVAMFPAMLTFCSH